MRIGIYTRISPHSTTTENQIPALEAWLNTQPENTAKWYKDEGFSGKNQTRPAFQELMQDVKLGSLDTVIAWSLDRLGRDTIQLLTFINELKEYNVDLLTIKDAINTKGPAGMMMITIMSSIAQFERERMLERQAEGIFSAKKRGVIWEGRQKGALNKTTMKKANLVGEMVKKGMSMAQVGRALNLDYRTVKKLLYKMKQKLPGKKTEYDKYANAVDELEQEGFNKYDMILEPSDEDTSR